MHGSDIEPPKFHLYTLYSNALTKFDELADPLKEIHGINGRDSQCNWVECRDDYYSVFDHEWSVTVGIYTLQVED